MKKEDIRKEFFLLRNAGHSYFQCKLILKAKFSFDASIKTLKRWTKRLNSGVWDLQDQSRRPHRIHYKITEEHEKKVLELRAKTGWGEDKIAFYLPELDLSPRAVNKILNKHALCRQSKSRGERRKYVRFERKHPNSLWQVDHTDEQELFDCYTISVVDDCSRYSLVLIKLKRVTTDVVTHLLDDIIKVHGKPREILTDNGGGVWP